MKILLAHKFHKYTGGAEVFYLEVGRVLEKYGHQVAYFSTKDEDTIPSEYEDYFTIAPDFKSNNLIDQIKSYSRIPYNFESKRKFKKLVEDFEPDIIHIFGIATQISPSILDVPQKYDIPVVASLNDYKHICPNYKLFHHGHLCEDCKGGKFYNAVKNRCSHNSFKYSLASAFESYIHDILNIYKKNIDLFLFASDFMAIKTEEFWGVDTFKWSKLRNPLQIPDLPNKKSSSNFGLYFGRFSDEKGIHLIINALKELRQVPFKLIGDGPLFSEIKALADQENLNNLEFLGAKWGKDMEEVLYDASYVVIPSLWHENFPYSVLQSFAFGKPVIGTNRGGIPELVTSERGIIIDPENEDELKLAIQKLYSDKALAKKLGIQARKFVKKQFSEEVFYADIMENYKTAFSLKHHKKIKN